MSAKFNIAKGVAGLASFTLQKILRRPGGFYPGKLALNIDNNLFEEFAKQLNGGSVLITGTNGKTSVTALLADCLEECGHDVVCNRGGANMASGIATALLQHRYPKKGKFDTDKKSVGVFETDELWVEKVLPKLSSSYLVLLDLFPDQEDRFGGISTIQKSLIKALEESPDTTLVYNVDDPNCYFVAKSVKNKTVGFGVAEKISATDEGLQDAQPQACSVCGAELVYSLRQYAQLGDFSCPKCDFDRPAPKYFANQINMTLDKLIFEAGKNVGRFKIESQNAAEYMVYNLLGYVAIANMMHCDDRAIAYVAVNQKNAEARLQFFDIKDKTVMINLAKNPAGFNQNIKYILDRVGPQAGDSAATPDNPVTVAFFVNAREGDGYSTYWLHDVDFGKFKNLNCVNIFIGGEAVDALTSRMRSLNIVAHRVETAQDVINASGIGQRIFIIANYTAVFPLNEELKKLANSQ